MARRPRRENPEREYEEMIATGIASYLVSLQRNLFPTIDSRNTDLMVAGITEGIHRYQERIGQPVTKTIIYNLLDTTTKDNV